MPRVSLEKRVNAKARCFSCKHVDVESIRDGAGSYDDQYVLMFKCQNYVYYDSARTWDMGCVDNLDNVYFGDSVCPKLLNVSDCEQFEEANVKEREQIAAKVHEVYRV